MELIPNHRRVLLKTGLAAAVLCLIAIVFIDGPLAVALRSLSSDVERGIQRAVAVCERLFAFGISPYLYGGLLVGAGLAALQAMKNTLVPWALLFVGLSHISARFVADILKPPFSRLRPFEALGSAGGHDTWFAPVGNSFPSGHAVHFWSLFFPLAVLFPRWRAAAVVLPVLVSAARVAVNDHYLSDVLASAALAAFITCAYAVTVLERGLGRLPKNELLS